MTKYWIKYGSDGLPEAMAETLKELAAMLHLHKSTISYHRRKGNVVAVEVEDDDEQ